MGKMLYREFIETLVGMLREHLGADYEIKVTDVVKNNGIQLTGVSIRKAPDRISPTIYLEEPYIQYCLGGSLGDVMDRVIACYEEQKEIPCLDVDFFMDYARVKGGIFHKLVNYEGNKKLLADIPHFKWKDLAIIFYYGMDEAIIGKASILVHNSHMNLWKQTPEMLFQTAQDNMRQKKPELLVPLRELLEEITESKIGEVEEVPIYVLTNRDKVYGASTMLYSEKMGELAKALQADLLILPCSVHEVLLVPDDGKEQYSYYRQLVEEVNSTLVDEEEMLSYHLYRYSREKAEIEEINV